MEVTRTWVPPGEDGGSVGAREHPDLRMDVPDLPEAAAVDPMLLGKDLPADDFLLDFPEGARDERRLLQTLLLGERFTGCRGDLLDSLPPLLLGQYFVGRPQVGCRHILDLAQILLAELLLLEGHFRTAPFAGHRLLDLQDGRKGAVRKENGVKDLLLGNLGGLPLHHQDRIPAPGDEDVDVAPRQVGDLGVDDQLSVDPADPGACDRALEGDRGKREGRGGPDHGEHRSVVHLVGGEDRRDDLDLVVEPFREEGPDRSVDHPGGEDLELGQPPFPLEEAARDLPDGRRLFHVIHNERKEVDARARGFGYTCGYQDHGFPVRNHRSAARLLCQLPGFNG